MKIVLLTNKVKEEQIVELSNLIGVREIVSLVKGLENFKRQTIYARPESFKLESDAIFIFDNKAVEKESELYQTVVEAIQNDEYKTSLVYYNAIDSFLVSKGEIYLEANGNATMQFTLGELFFTNNSASIYKASNLEGSYDNNGLAPILLSEVVVKDNLKVEGQGKENLLFWLKIISNEPENLLYEKILNYEKARSYLYQEKDYYKENKEGVRVLIIPLIVTDKQVKVFS